MTNTPAQIADFPKQEPFLRDGQWFIIISTFRHLPIIVSGLNLVGVKESFCIVNWSFSPHSLF